uniref:Uncharacterized protein n=1 Tax=Pyrodinium bahamense TaxID=73915 RepID=A0A7S0F826_9DINO|mmetsp:Transcript_11179/g.30510  ORF Transcript_11179/g.30510 Transcript_11179/m.30510 type:complete len:252 (+) Transcript_11179:117-872(+)
MGGGASSRPASRTLPSAADKDNGTVDMVEGGMQWLLSVVDKEKQEKEWLAGKYDEKCAEVKALQQEIAILRNELNSQRTVSMEERQRTPPLRGMAPDVMSKVAGDTASFNMPTPTGGSSSSTDPSVSPAGGKLKERRGLKLSIETPSRNATRLSPTEVISPVQEEPEELPTRQARTGAGGSSDDSVAAEPMSALLRRRKEDWSVDKIITKTENNSTRTGSLNVKPEKVFSMLDDTDCPTSPKRRLSNAALR